MSSPNTNGYSSSAAAAAAAAAAGRKRQTPGAPVYSPNETLNQMTQEAEARQQDKYNVQKEIRAIRAQEMEKQRKEDEEREREENQSNNNNSRYNSRSSSVTTSSGSSTKGRLNSTSRQLDENLVVDPDSPRELKRRLAELEEKYTKHAIFQTQFENDNQKLLYEVDILKDIIEENDELIVELRRQFKEKARELEFQKRSTKDIQTDFLRLKEILNQRDQLIKESGLILYTDNEAKEGFNADLLHDHIGEIKSVLPAALISPETGKLLDMMGEGTIDDKLRKLLDTKQELKETNNKMKTELEEKETKIANLERKIAQNASKIHDSQEQANDLHELQRQYTKEINDFKMKNQKLEHENIVIKQDLQRLQTQLKYMQTNFDELEQSEQRLNKEKREAQRELKESKNLIKELQDRVERLEISQKTFEKKRQLSKFNDLTSSTTSSSTVGGGGGSLSSSFSLTPTINANYEQQTPKDTSIHDDERSQRNSKLLQSSDLPSSAPNAHPNDQMLQSTTSTVNTESSSPTLSSRSSTSSSSASNSPQESTTKETTLSDECSTQQEIINGLLDADINKTPISTKKQKNCPQTKQMT